MNALIYHGERALPRCLTGEGPAAVEGLGVTPFFHVFKETSCLMMLSC